MNSIISKHYASIRWEPLKDYKDKKRDKQKKNHSIITNCNDKKFTN